MTEPTGDSTQLDSVLARLAVPGVDPRTASDSALKAIGARTRRNRLLATGAVATLLIVGVGITTLWGGDDSNEVVAAGTSTTTERERVERDTTTVPALSSATTTPTSTTAAPITLPPVQTTTASSVAPTAAPSTTQATTTVPVDQPAGGRLVVSNGPAGSALKVSFEWSDPDGPGTRPTIVVSTDEPGVVPPAAPRPQSGSCSGGPGSTASLHDTVQFASTGRRIVRVSIAYCNAAPQVYSSAVEVAAPAFEGEPGRAVIAELPQLATGDPRWSLTADSGTTYQLAPPVAGLAHPMGSTGGYSRTGVVLIVPAGETGTITYQAGSADGPTWVGRLDPVVLGAPASRITMSVSG